MAGYSVFVALHIAGGAVALAAFWSAALLRKGSPAHRLVGRGYLLAMLAVIASGVPLTAQRLIDGHPVGATFLAYLLLLVSTSVWLSWRAIRDRQDPSAYLGRVYGLLAYANPLAGLAVLALGIDRGQPLLTGFSVVGVMVGVDMLRRRRVIPTQPRWWLEEHYSAMVANGAATHIAFLAIGLPRLLPVLQGQGWYYAGWFAPVLLAIVAKAWLNRRFRLPAGGTAQTSPSLSQPSPVPRL